MAKNGHNFENMNFLTVTTSRFQFLTTSVKLIQKNMTITVTFIRVKTGHCDTVGVLLKRFVSHFII